MFANSGCFGVVFFFTKSYVARLGMHRGIVLFRFFPCVVGRSVTGCFSFCFESCIYNPLHAARRAMAAAVPLLRGSDGFF